MNEDRNEVVININELQKQLENKKESHQSKSKEFFYCSKGLVEKLNLKINNNSIFDKNSKQVLYAYNEYLEAINRNFIKQYNKFYLVITLLGGVKIEFEGNIFNNKLYHNGFFIIYLNELIQFCKAKLIKDNEKYYEYFSIFISNLKNNVKSEITLEGETNYYTSNPIVINDIPYINCLFEFYVYC